MLHRYHTLAAVLVCLLLTACGGGGAPGSAALVIPQVPSVPSNSASVSAETGAAGVATPPADEPTDSFLLQALQLCLSRQNQGSVDEFNKCIHSTRHEEVIRWSVALYERVIATDGRLIGRDLRIRLVRGGDTLDLGGSTLNLAICEAQPGGPKLNAFATNDLAVMLVPLMDAFHEGACAYAELVAAAGGDPDAVDPGTLLVALGIIFDEVSKGNPYSLISEAECDMMIAIDEIAFEAYWGAVAFVLFHEIAHANLRHGLVKCLTREGILKVLADNSITPTPQEELDLLLAFSALSRALEAQSDIYSATILEQLGFSTNGPGLFIFGFIGKRLIDGSCDTTLPQDQLLACLISDSPAASHPPFDVRANIIGRIIEGGEDLTAGLRLLSALQ